MAELFFTGSEFEKNGVPFLVDKKMELISSPNRWLTYIALERARTQSTKTWRAYGYHMLYYFDFLEVNELEWQNIASSELAAYRRSLESKPSARSKPLDVNSIRNYMLSVIEFYKWAYREGLISALPFRLELVRTWREGDRGFYSDFDKSGELTEITDIVPCRQKREAKYISRAQQTKLVKEVLRSEEDKILYAFLLQTGLRLEEVVRIKLHDIPEEDVYGNTLAYSFNVIGKGNKQRAARVGHPLLVELLKWRDFGRYRLAKKWKKKTGTLPDTFFLNTKGGPITTKSLWYRVKRWGEKAGLHLHTHMFRHTFAFKYYGKYKDVVALKKLLGHARLSSTEIYSHLDPDALAETVTDLDEEIMTMMFNVRQDHNGHN